MPITIHDNGHNNRVEINHEVMENGTADVVLSGSDNHVSISRGVSLSHARIMLGSGCSLNIGPDCRLAAIEVMADRDAHLTIGARTQFTWSTRLYLHEPSRLIIGQDCLVASGVLIMTSDMHSILDLQTGRRLNSAADITIADKVWLGYESTIMKGASVGTGSIIGYRSIVRGVIPNNSLAVGAPARVVKTGVSWDPRLL